MSEGWDGVSGICHRCGQFRLVVWHEGAAYCPEHRPLKLSVEDFAMIFDKAGVPGQVHKQVPVRGMFSKRLKLKD